MLSIFTTDFLLQPTNDHLIYCTLYQKLQNLSVPFTFHNSLTSFHIAFNILAMLKWQLQEVTGRYSDRHYSDK